MIGIFKNNLFINSLLLLPYIIILRIRTLFEPVAYTVTEQDPIIVKSIFGFVSSPLAQSIIAIVLVYLQAVFINRIVIKNNISNAFTLIPGLMYGILTGFFPAFTSLSPFLIANTLVLLMISQLFAIYKAPRVADHVFNVGFCLGVVCLLVPNFIYLLVIAVFSILILRSIKQKELVQLTAGLFTLFFIVFGVMYLYDIPVLPEASKLNFAPRLSVFSLRGMAIYKLIGWFALAAFTVLNYNTYTFKKSIHAQKKIDILFWILLGAGAILFFFENVEAYNALLLCIPLSVFLAINLINIRNPLAQELIHVVMIGLLFAFNFGLI